jgi:hypothetical protein
MEASLKANLVLWPIHGSDGSSRGLEDSFGRCGPDDAAFNTSIAKNIRRASIHSFFAIV